jgi:hypothetical protein
MSLISKADFARALGVGRSAVTNHIRRGQLTGAALVAVDGHVMVDEVVARAQLERRLDPEQRMRNGRARLSDDSADDPMVAAIKSARLRQIELSNAKAEAEARVRSGDLLAADGARAEVGRGAARVVALYDSEIPQLATEIAAASKMPVRDAIHMLRTAFRRAGERMAAAETKAAHGLLEAVQ